jgi:peptidoglycan/xylan/chitin deacetylase (PgdA/CDA1 family)
MRKFKTIVIVFGVIFLSGFLLVNFIQQKYVAPILMYHSVNPDAAPENRLAVSVKAFQRQMRFLKNNRYNVLPLEAIAHLIKEKKKIPPRTCAITFDDGYKDNYKYVFPILKKYNLAATIFVIINEVGRPQNDRLSWNEIKLMQDSGIITLGSHALGPEPLVNIESEDDLKREIFDSKKILEEKLGKEVSAFSYPEGRFNNEIRRLVIAAGYKLAVATNPGRKYPGDDIFALKRLRISFVSDNLFVFWIKTTGFYTFIKERRK